MFRWLHALKTSALRKALRLQIANVHCHADAYLTYSCLLTLTGWGQHYDVSIVYCMQLHQREVRHWGRGHADRAARKLH